MFRPRRAIPASVVTALALGAVFVAIGLLGFVEPEAGVWGTHLGAGRTLWRGEVPSSPAYPMWGYSLLAAPLGGAVVFVQIAMLLGLVAWWLPALVRGVEGRSGPGRWLSSPVALVVVLAPWIWLATSHSSNAPSSLIAWAGTWTLIVAAQRDAGPRRFLAAGALLGLAANFRTENLLLAGLLALGFGVHAGCLGTWKKGALRASAVGFGAVLAMIPWLLYTQQTLGSPRLTSTNGGGVMYLGLGALRDNPWGVDSNDDYAHEIAQARVGTRAWSAPANEMFGRMFRDAVMHEPLAFARRVIAGWRMALTQGLEVPPIRHLVCATPEDARLADYLNERAKSALGLAVNQRELSAYEAEGISSESLSMRHYAMVLGDYGVRASFAGLFAVLLAMSVLVAWRLGSRAGATWAWLAWVAMWLLVAGGIQTLPRHTTMILPALVTVIVLGSRNRRELLSLERG